VQFFPAYLTHSKGDLGGRPLVLEPWQADFVRRLFGTLRPDGMRQYRTAFLAIPRKNGKSTLCAGIAIKLLFDGEPGAEVYSCAADRDQARLVFEMAKACVDQNADLSSRLETFRNSIVRSDNHSTYKALSAEAGTKHGLNAHGVIFDELHAQPNRKLVDVMATSMGARRQPLLVYITTAGYDRKSVCWELWKYAEAVRDGAIKDPTFLPMIYAAQPGRVGEDGLPAERVCPCGGDAHLREHLPAAVPQPMDRAGHPLAPHGPLGSRQRRLPGGSRRPGMFRWAGLGNDVRHHGPSAAFPTG